MPYLTKQVNNMFLGIVLLAQKVLTKLFRDFSNILQGEENWLPPKVGVCLLHAYIDSFFKNNNQYVH